MINKRDILIAIIFFLIGSVVMYFYDQKTIQSNEVLNDKIMANCGAAMTAASQLVKNCNQTKTEVISCYSDLKSCDQKEFNNKMDALLEKARLLDIDLTNYTKEMEGLLNTYKK